MVMLRPCETAVTATAGLVRSVMVKLRPCLEWPSLWAVPLTVAFLVLARALPGPLFGLGW